LFASVTVADEAGGVLPCGQEPGKRFLWVERAFCDVPVQGPAGARGVIIWNHGIHGTSESWKTPAPPAFRLLQARGWDVVILKRHHLGEASPGGPLQRTVERTLAEAASLRRQGYRKIVLAGQSFGGHVTLEALDTPASVFAAIVFAPGLRMVGGGEAPDLSATERLLERARADRLVLVFPGDDTVFGSAIRGARAETILARRDVPYLLVDETGGISGHAGGMTGRFAVTYGLCLADFLDAAVLPQGRFVCQPPPGEWPVVRELLLPRADRRPTPVAADRLPRGLSALAGLHWAFVNDSAVLLALVEDRGRLRLFYSSTGFGARVLDVSVTNGVAVATLPNQATIRLSPGSITWTSADRTRTTTAVIRPAPHDP
jgi:dienelactone hydrolase